MTISKEKIMLAEKCQRKPYYKITKEFLTMKKIISIVLSLCLVFTSTIFAAAEESTIVVVRGKFYLTHEGTICASPDPAKVGKLETFYQFRSNDGKVWWSLTEEEIGFIPDTLQALIECNIISAGKSIDSLSEIVWNEYILVYDNNGTTVDNKPCDCLPEYECECEVYDDEFITLIKV